MAQKSKELSTLFALDLKDAELMPTFKKYHKDSIFVSRCAKYHFVIFFTDYSLVAIEEHGDIHRVYVVSASSNMKLFSTDFAIPLLAQMVLYVKKQATLTKEEQESFDALVEKVVFTQAIDTPAGKKTINDLIAKGKCDHFPDVNKKGQPCMH